MNAATHRPWYQHTYRWGQTNITEIDPTRYDIAWWREHWRRTRVQGVIINAGGIVAYYRSQLPLTHYAEFLGGRDLFGELVDAARQEGLAVLARMDSNRVHAPFFVEHPDWMAVDAEGRPYRAGDLYVTCVDSPYYQEYLPAVLREIAERYHPDGFTDNSFSGPDRDHISYSTYAAHHFKAATGLDLPRKKDWNDPAYRQWIQWSYARRLEIWDLNNRTTKAAGGADCLWLGMIWGDVIRHGANFREYKAIAERSEIIMLDFQARPRLGGFKQNGEIGKLVHGLLGWDKLIPESTAMYEHAPHQVFRVASKSGPEARLWALEGFAGGIQPWWHHIGAYHEDRRQYRIAEPLFRWHEKNEHYLINRQPIASVGVVWSQQNNDFYGRDDAENRVELPWQGITQALVRARIPYLPLHVDRIERDTQRYAVLLLPNIGALSERQCETLRRYVRQGGALIATGETSLYDEWGDRRADFALADVFGAHWVGPASRALDPKLSNWNDWSQHTYLRLSPERRVIVDGPIAGNEPVVTGERHPILQGFDDTDILAFGGSLLDVHAEPDCRVPLTYIPPFPVYPPETSWMRTPTSHQPAIVLRDDVGQGKVVYMAADIDRCFARNNLPDHALLLANIVRWAAGDSIPLAVQGNGLIDCHLYHQPGRMILHLINLTGTDTRPLYEFVPVGPHAVRVRLEDDVTGHSVRLLVSERKLPTTVMDRWTQFEVSSIADHEVAVIQ